MLDTSKITVQSSIKIILAAAAGLVMFGLFAGDAFAGHVTIHGTHPPSDIAGHCHAAGGSFYNSGGVYGCFGPGGDVTCSGKSQKCFGTCGNCSAQVVGKGGLKGVLAPTRGVKQVGSGAQPTNPRGPKGKSNIETLHAGAVRQSGDDDHPAGLQRSHGGKH
jgi:hypothetical protein